MATVLSRAQHGMEAPLVRVEVHLGSGLPRFAIVGLPEAVVKESKDRVRAAIVNCELADAGRAHHGQSVAGGSAEGRRALRSADRARHPARFRSGRAAAVRELRVVRRAVARRRDQAGARRAARGNRGRARRTSHDRAAEQRCGDAAGVGLSGRCREASARCRRACGRIEPAELRERRGAARSSRLNIRTCAKCAARRKRSARSKSRRPASTASCSSGRQAPARACWRSGCRDCCRR